MPAGGGSARAEPPRQHRKAGVALEFVGLPGAGKTTIAKAVAQGWRSDGGEVCDAGIWIYRHSGKLRRAGHQLRLHVTHFGLACSLYGALVRLSGLHAWRLVGGVLVSAERHARRSAACEQGGLIVLDQGIWHALRVLGARAGLPPAAWAPWAVRLANKVADGDGFARALVVVDVSPTVAAARVGQRRGDATTGSLQQQQILDFRRQGEVQEAILEHVTQRDTGVLRVDGHAQPEASAAEIIRWLQRGFEGRAR